MGEKRHGPGIMTLLVYLIGAASLTGGLSGWVHASGAFEWLTELNSPNWTPSYTLLNTVGLFIPVFAVIALWVTQTAGRQGTRTWASLLELIWIAGMTTQILVFFPLRDPALGFLAALLMWLFAFFATGLISRASRTASVLLWPALGWHSFLVVLGFELMRLNNGATFAGGL